MELQDLTHLLQHSEAITVPQTDALLLKINEFPYFQPLRALYLKGLKQKESYKYNNALKVTAAYTTDRSVLFDYITSKVFNQNKISQQIKQNSQAIKTIELNTIDDISVNKSITIDDDLKPQIKTTKDVLNSGLFAISKQIEDLKQIELEKPKATEAQSNSENNTLEKKLNIGKPLVFNKSENHSFSEWLKLTSIKSIKRENEEVSSTPPLLDKLAIIDRFISENPKIKPVTSNHSKPKLVNNKDVFDSIMTETLARIYLEQKNYEKAIQSYKILSLKYPEKSSFFADQIKAIEELKENNNI